MTVKFVVVLLLLFIALSKADEEHVMLEEP